MNNYTKFQQRNFNLFITQCFAMYFWNIKITDREIFQLR